MKNRIFSYSIISTLLFLSACSTTIKGTVTQSFGNLMPSPDAPNATPVALQTTIAFCEPYLFSGENVNDGVYKELPSTLVKQTITNTSGFYKISLPNGKYSVFIKINEGWYAREVIDGFVNLVTIEDGKKQIKDIQVKYKTTQ